MSDNKVYDLLEKIANLPKKTKRYSKDEKLKAAYALNLCMVSVSQIVDYNDRIILEQEYEAILNNLNLEHMPKDEAFLDILKNILDTITFFRIQEGDKKFIEKEYNQKMKNAIWSGVSSIPIFAMSGDPVTMAISVATTVGSAYMNYRRAKADAILEKEKQEWELQRSAMEQFNGLRRELFNTAWKIASEYDFPDEYRLTEKQITQYDDILMDNNYQRRYDRLDAIKENFKAYPAFWYFFGNTAAVLANDYTLSEELRADYRDKAKSHFETYFETNCHGLLREDQITASWALEYIDLLDVNNDKEKIQALLGKAVNMCGNSFDILQLCAIGYLKIEDYQNAANILKILVNEDYNKSVNAQLLSKIYVFDYIHNTDKRILLDYEKLTHRAENTVLMPMPEKGDESSEILEKRFIDAEKIMIHNRLLFVLGSLSQKYTVLFNKTIDPFKGNNKDEYYLDTTEKAVARRKKDTLEIFNNFNRRRKYLNELAQVKIFSRYLDIFNSFLPVLFKLSFIDESAQTQTTNSITESLKTILDTVNEAEQKIAAKDFSFEDYNTLCQITFSSLTEDAFKIVLKAFGDTLNGIDSMQKLSELDGQIEAFREENKLPEIVYKNDFDTEIKEEQCISPEAFGEDVFMEYQKQMNFRKMRQIIEESTHEIIDSESPTTFLLQGTDDFENYCNSNKKTEKYIRDTIAIFDIEGPEDLAFTTYGIQKISGAKLVKYDQVSCKGNKLMLDGTSYKVSGINIFAFEELCGKLSELSEDINRWSLYFDASKKELIASTVVATAAFGIPGAVAATAAAAAGYALPGVALTAAGVVGATVGAPVLLAAGAVGAAGAAIGSAIKKAANKSADDSADPSNDSKAEKEKQEKIKYNKVISDLEKLFLIDSEQTRIMYSIQLRMIQYDIDNSPLKTDKDYQVQQRKIAWRDQWKQEILNNVCADKYRTAYFIKDDDFLYSELNKCLIRCKSYNWIYLVALECTLFKPYSKFSKNDKNIWKGLKVKSDYLCDVFCKKQHKVSNDDIKIYRSTYKKNLSKLDKNFEKAIITATTIAIASLATGGAASVLAPEIAVAIVGDSLLLSGAALTNASLALIGGGSLAVGGMGMAGGTAIITGGGVLVGALSSGMSATAAGILSVNGLGLHSSALLLTFCDVVLKKQKNFDIVAKHIIDALKENVENCEKIKNEIKTQKEKDKEDKEILKQINENLKYINRCISILEKEKDKFTKKLT